MDISRDFFGKLRALALTLEKEARQLERALRKEDTDYEDEAPIRALYDFLCEIRTLKEDINDSCGKSCSEKQAIREFMKASEILMQRNAADLGKIRELFQKYGYKPHGKDFTEKEEVEVNSDSTMSVQNKSDKKADDVPHLPGCPEKPQVPKDPLRNPQLSDFGLSQYAFSRPWSAVKRQHTTNAYQENSRSKTPLKTQAPSILPKTPKCMLKMDDYVCITPKLEHFGISEHTMCMNEDYTMSLIRKTAQTSKKLVKKDDHEVTLPEMTSKEIMVTPGPKPKVTAENANWVASPRILVFYTPDVNRSSRTNNTVLSRSPQTNERPPPSHTGTPRFPDFEARWLKTEAEQVKQGGKTESVTKSDATDKQCIEDSISFTVSSDEYLKHLRDPSPPKIKHYDQLLNTPPPPEITRIPDDVLQILSKYDHKVDSSKAKEMKTKTGNTTRYESDFTDYCNKENRGYPGFFKPNI
ncbi:spindle and kinetochore-associated protein 3 isoform X1 [Strix aluco]|uniref:spindle and kinetochore-associated protein 3 isoform X1 n=1 Tax=Strix aluco TaxID=111821 RepID=UPI003DA501EC